MSPDTIIMSPEDYTTYCMDQEYGINSVKRGFLNEEAFDLNCELEEETK